MAEQVHLAVLASKTAQKEEDKARNGFTSHERMVGMLAGGTRKYGRMAMITRA